MKLLNKSKGILLSSDAGIAGTFLSRARGLMLSSPADLVLISPREAIPPSSIHMLLMRYPIDVIWLDLGKKVVDIQRRVPPANPLRSGTLRVYKPATPAKYVIELGKGSAGETEVGDVISFS